MAKKFTIECDAEAEFLERARAVYQEIHRATAEAPDGQAVKVCEERTLEAVLKLGRMLCEDSLQARIDDLEKKGVPAGRVNVGRIGKARGRGPRHSS